MISSFLESWSLFAPWYIASGAAAVLLSLLGVPVVARDQVFIGAAVTQAATLGIAVALTVGAAVTAGGWADRPAVLSGFAVAFSIAATLVTMRHSRTGQTREAVTGWVFLFSAAAIVLLLADSPLNMDDVQRLLLSNTIGASWADAVVFTIGAGLVLAAALVFRRALSLWVMDRTMAAGVGMRVTLIEVVFAVLLGAALGLALQTAGMLYALGCLVLPAMIAKQVSRRVGPMFLIAPAVALVGAVVGFVLAHGWNYPPSPVVVMLLAVAMGPGYVVRRYVLKG